MAFDTLILNGTVVDGTGAPRYNADVGITNGRIEAIGTLSHAEAARRIDATDHVVAPGFIDMHSHSDITLLDDPGGESKAHQGVTTEVTGNCSYTPWPAGEGGPEALQKNLGRTLIGSVKWEWHTLDDWASAMGVQRNQHQRRAAARTRRYPDCVRGRRGPARDFPTSSAR